MEMIKKVSMISIHGVKYTSFDQVKGQRTSFHGVGGFRLCCSGACQFQSAISNDECCLVNRNFFWSLFLKKLMSSCREFSRPR